MRIKKKRVSMFRCAFHTGYVPPKVMRLTKAQLDGACGDRRFADDFFLDFIFEPCNEATASQHLMTGEASNDSKQGNGGEAPANEAAERRSMGTSKSASNVISASAYDSMLHRDSRFWDVISQRREENMKKQAILENTIEKDSEVKEEESTTLSGPTIGRRRDFASKKAGSGSKSEKEDSEGSSSSAKAKNKQDRMDAFIIGDDFGLGGDSKPLETPLTPKAKKKDSLMEALMDVEDDGLEDEEGEVVFDSGDADIPSKAPAPEVPSLPIKASASKESNSDKKAHQVDNTAAVSSSDVSSKDQEAIAGPDDNETTTENKKPDIPAIVNSSEQEKPKDDTDPSSDLTGLGEDLANLDTEDGAEDLDFDEFDDNAEFEDDELEDLENFLTKVSSN